MEEEVEARKGYGTWMKFPEVAWPCSRLRDPVLAVSSGPKGFKPELLKGDRNDNIQITECQRGLNVINRRPKTPRTLSGAE